MNKKLPIYILIAYFIFVIIILAVQLTSRRGKNYVVVDFDEKLNNAVVMYEKSPIMLKQQNQTFINGDNTSETPITLNGVNYVSLECYKNGFDAVISDSKDKATLKLNNQALVMSIGSRAAVLSSAEKDKKIKLEFPPEKVSGEWYLSVRDFADIFDYEIFYYDGLIILSNMKDIFDVETDLESVVKVKELVYNLPIAGGYDKMKELCRSKEEEQPSSEETFITHESPKLQICDINNIYYVENGKVIKADNMNSQLSSADLPEGLTGGKAEVINGYVCVTGENNGRAVLCIYDMTQSNGALLRTIALDGKPAGLVYDRGYLYFAAISSLTEEAKSEEEDYIPSDPVNMRYFPEKTGNKILNVCSVQGESFDGPTDITGYCGVSDYVSICPSGIYIAMTDENKVYNDAGNIHTNIYRLGYSEGKSVFAGKIRLDGGVVFAATDKPAFFISGKTGEYNYYLTDSVLSLICRKEGLSMNVDSIYGGENRIFIKEADGVSIMDMNTGELLGKTPINDGKVFLYNDDRLIGFSQLLPPEEGTEATTEESAKEEQTAEETAHTSIKMTMYDVENPSNMVVLSEDVIENADDSMFSELSLRILGDVAVLPVKIWNDGNLFDGNYTYTINSIYGLNFNSSDSSE